MEHRETRKSLHGLKITLVYKSKSGFTERYARWIAQETGCALLPWKDAGISTLSGCDVLVFGGRLHAGRLDGLAKARQLCVNSGVRRFIVFATGAMPNAAADTIEKMWQQNLSDEELRTVPHFYFQAGLCYERLGPLDRALMRMAASMMAKRGAKDPAEAQMLQTLKASYDICDRQYIAPLTDLLKNMT